jgi:hypothetical protein
MTALFLWGSGRRWALVGLCCCTLVVSGCKRKTASSPESLQKLATDLKRLDVPARPEEIVADDAKAPLPPDAPVITLDTLVLNTNAKLTGTLTAQLRKGNYHLVWIDGANRVVAAYELDAKQMSGATTPFNFPRPAGCIGESHVLALVNCVKGTPEKSGVFETLAQIRFRAARPLPPWNDYAVLSDAPMGDDSALQSMREAGIDGIARVGDIVPPDQMHPFLTAPWLDGATPYSRSRNIADLERHPALFDEHTLAAVKNSIDASVASQRLAPPVAWSLGNELSLTEKSWPLDFDMSPETLAVFRAWLEERYGTIANLNARWSTHYKEWAQVRPPSTDEVKAAHNRVYAQRLAELTPPPGALINGAAAVAEGNKFEQRGRIKGFALKHEDLRPAGGENFAAWVDFREFGAFAFSRVLREYRAHLRDIAPPTGEPARAGLRGALGPSTWGGWEWSQLSKTLDWVESDSPLARELSRSFASVDGNTRALRFVAPFAARTDADVFRLWDGWLRGDAGCFVKTSSVQNADAPQKFLSELPVLTQGLTLLRENARRIGDPVTIYYSPRSMALHWMLDSEADGAFWLSRSGAFEAQHSSALLQLQAWQALLEDLGYAPHCIQPQQLIAGSLRKSKTKILILPKVLSLSDDEARAIRDFAKSGGVVIADGECGTFDGAGRRVAAEKSAEAKPLGILDRDFGIARRDFRALELNGEFDSSSDRPRVSLRGDVEGESSGPSSAELRVLEPGIVPNGARWHAASEGGAPALLVKSSGAGRFVYLNLALQDYPALCEKTSNVDFQFLGMSPEQYAEKYGAPRGGEALRLVLGDLLGEAAAENPLKVRYDDGSSVRGIRRARFALGRGAYLFGLLPRGSVETADGADQVKGMHLAPIPDVSVAWNTSRHWYDPATGTYLGEGSAVKTSLDPCRATLLAALPYRVEKIGLKIRRIDSSGGFKFSASLVASSGELASHVFHLEIYGPDGNRLSHYAANALAENGAWNGEIHLGLNESPGYYRLLLRDCVTGVSAEGQLVKDSAGYSGLHIDK